MLVNSSMTAKAVENCCVPKRATAASSALMALFLVLPFRKNGTAVNPGTYLRSAYDPKRTLEIVQKIETIGASPQQKSDDDFYQNGM